MSFTVAIIEVSGDLNLFFPVLQKQLLMKVCCYQVLQFTALVGNLWHFDTFRIDFCRMEVVSSEYRNPPYSYFCTMLIICSKLGEKRKI